MDQDNVWKDFVFESHKILRQSTGFSELGNRTYLKLHQDVAEGHKSPQEALEELSKSETIVIRVNAASNAILNEYKNTVGQQNEIICDQLKTITPIIKDIRKDGLELLLKQKEVNTKLDRAKKRTLKFFCVTLAVSLTSAASKLDWFDGVKEQPVKAWLFAKQAFTAHAIRDPLPHDPVPDNHFLKLWNNGAVVKVRLKNQSAFIYRESSTPLKAKQPLTLASPSTH
ncbi:MAG TPA: hypothetical protein DCY07_03210 [Rhodospirillaceae bacterium]|nr:hypothetical protein [Rhodospirillaceae bacterium]